MVSSHPAIVVVASPGAPDDNYGERVCLFVVGQTTAIVRRDRRGRPLLAVRQKTQERIVVLDKLPERASGKVKKTCCWNS